MATWLMKSKDTLESTIGYVIYYTNWTEQDALANESFRKTSEILWANPLANPIVLVKESKISQVIDELQKKIEFLKAPENQEAIDQFIYDAWSPTKQIEKKNVVSRGRLITWCKKAIKRLSQRKYAILQRLLERTAGTRVDEITHKEIMRVLTEKPLPYKTR